MYRDPQSTYEHATARDYHAAHEAQHREAVREESVTTRTRELFAEYMSSRAKRVELLGEMWCDGDLMREVDTDDAIISMQDGNPRAFNAIFAAFVAKAAALAADAEATAQGETL